MNTSIRSMQESNKNNSSFKIYFLKPFLAGLFGFVLVLVTLLLTYFITYNIFDIKYFAIESTDLLICLLGFVLLFWFTLRKAVR